LYIFQKGKGKRNFSVLISLTYFISKNLPGTPTRTTAHKVTYFRGITLLGAILVLWPVPLLTLDRLMLNVCAAYYIFLSGPVSDVEYDYFKTLMAKSWIARTKQK
jgi:hypothetical protein